MSTAISGADECLTRTKLPMVARPRCRLLSSSGCLIARVIVVEPSVHECLSSVRNWHERNVLPDRGSLALFRTSSAGLKRPSDERISSAHGRRILRRRWPSRGAGHRHSFSTCREHMRTINGYLARWFIAAPGCGHSIAGLRCVGVFYCAVAARVSRAEQLSSSM